MKYAPPIGQESQGEDAHYVDGNPELGILGSPVPAAAIEQGQRELLHVIKQAGLTPSGDDLTQLWQALEALFRQKVPIATEEKAGIVKPGSGLSVGEDGTLDVTVSAAIPGTIVAFSGSFGGEDGRHPIPLGGSEPDAAWLLCDGGSDGKGGTVPDLRGRMIMGASDAYAAGSTGGTATHTHALSGSVGATTLSGAQLASHTHPAAASYLIYASGDVPVAGGNYRHTASAAPAAGGSQSHTHTISGSSGQASTLPPYYALAYIMRVA